MASATGDWCLIESDPGVFTELIRGFGCTGVQVEELWSLDESTLDNLKPVHGLIFLFKWRSNEDPEGTIVQDNRMDTIFFAKQVINNACATQAILSVLLNTTHPDLQLGETLTTFKEFSVQFDPSLKGLSLSNSETIKQVHNSFARQQMFEFDNSMKDQDNDVYHFVAYVPINGRLYELDGLKDGPIDHGPYQHNDWVKTFKPIIEKRMQRYSAEEVHFNLLGIVSDRKRSYLKQIEDLHHRKQEILDKVESLLTGQSQEGREPMDTSRGKQTPEELQKMLRQLEQEISHLLSLVASEDEKMLKYKIENIRRRHNYLPFIMELLKILGKKGELVRLVEKAKAMCKPKSASKQDAR